MYVDGGSTMGEDGHMHGCTTIVLLIELCCLLQLVGTVELNQRKIELVEIYLQSRDILGENKVFRRK